MSRIILNTSEALFKVMRSVLRGSSPVMKTSSFPPPPVLNGCLKIKESEYPAYAGRTCLLLESRSRSVSTRQRFLGSLHWLAQKKPAWPSSLETEANIQFKSDRKQRFLYAPSVIWGLHWTVQHHICDVPWDWVKGQKGVPKILLLWNTTQR